MRKRALIVGQNSYSRERGFNPLRFAREDAYELYYFLEPMKQFEMERPLIDARSTTVIDAIEESISGLDRGDLFVFYFSGHGAYRASSDRYILICPDARRTVLDRPTDAGTLSSSYLHHIAGTNPFDSLFIFDTCRDCLEAARGADTVMSGVEALLGTGAGVARTIGTKGEKGLRPGRYVRLAACGNGDKAYEDGRIKGGVFTWSLLRVMRRQKERGEEVKVNEVLIGEVSREMAGFNSIRCGQSPAYSSDPEGGIILLPGNETREDADEGRDARRSSAVVVPDAAEAAYNLAFAEDSIEAWTTFIRKHPDSRYSSEARERLKKLRVEAIPLPLGEGRVMAGPSRAEAVLEKKAKIDLLLKSAGQFPLAENEAREHQRLAGEVHQFPVEITNDIGIKLRLIPAGSFMMGASRGDSDADSDEMPRHRVEITRPFYIGVYEVTQAQYERVMGSNPSYFKGADRPEEQVSWNDAQEFCRKLSEKTGEKYRLPTEAEWEYACRAGTETAYYWGANMDGAYAWYDKNSGGQAHKVGQKRPNAWHLYDMSGNVWEWCCDGYDSDYYNSSPGSDPRSPSSGDVRVLRGGSWSNFGGYLRSSGRSRGRPQNRYVNLGLRVVRDVK